MVCDDCFETDECRCGPGEMCGVCFESKRECPQGNGLHCQEHGPYCCHCGMRLRDVPKKPDLRCKCGHPRSSHDHGSGCIGNRNLCLCHGFVCDHTACGWKPPEEAHDYVSPSHCKACMRAWIGPDAVLGDELPLTPEEEEEAPEDENACEDCLRGVHGPNAHREEPPPQPDRRPPYAVAYSVSGHLYEVALSGDATVRAVDGALVIQHHLGPVAGIVSVLPVINKESNG